MLTTNFRFIWQSGFRGKCFKIDQPETRIVCGGHVRLSGAREDSNMKSSLMTDAKRWQKLTIPLAK